MSAPGFLVLLISAMSCSVAPTLENGSCPKPVSLLEAELQNEWEYDSYPQHTMAIYNCRPGYTRLGTIKTVCLHGKWEFIGRKGQCRKKSCGHPGDIPFGSFQLREEDAFVFGAIVEYVCDEGYYMMGKETTRECKENGWTNRLPQCENRCQKPEPIKGTHLQGDWTEETYPPGKVANFVSENTQDGPIKMACVEGTWWHVSKDHCKDIKSGCTVPDSPGILRSPYHSSYQIGSEVIFLCKTGFSRDGSLNSYCTTDGWNPPLPTCKEIQCTIPKTTNILRNPVKLVYRENDDVSFRCEKGFTIEGSNTVTCTRNGWNPPLPTCEGIGEQCGPPPLVPFGDTKISIKSSYKSGESVEYKCPEFYVLQGKKIVKCLNGVWEEAPVCQEPCTVKETEIEERNIHPNWKANRKVYIEHGGSIEFSCKAGYQVHAGTSTRIICEQGKLQYPTCFKIK